MALWLGGVERLYAAGIKNLGVIQDSQLTRKQNTVIFQNGKSLLSCKIPDLPLFIDPSHITGNRNDFRSNSRSFRFEL
jgi:chorismate mutase